MMCKYNNFYKEIVIKLLFGRINKSHYICKIVGVFITSIKLNQLILDWAINGIYLTKFQETILKQIPM